MAKQAQVTRTITTTVAEVLCVDTTTQTTTTISVTLPRTYKDEKDLMKAVKNIVDTDTVKSVTVLSTNIVETLYGMLESEFIKHASVLPPRKTATADEQ